MCNAIIHSYGAACIEVSDNVVAGTTYSRYSYSTDSCNGIPMGKASFIFGVISKVIPLLLIK